MKFIVLAASLAIVYSKTYKMELRSTGSLRTRVMTNEKNQNYPAMGNVANGQLLEKRLVPFRDYYDLYVGNVTIGTPGQNMSLLTDTGSANLWVFDTTCRVQELIVNIICTGATIENQDFIRVTEADDAFLFMPIDGILGLGRSGITVGKVTSPLQNILGNLDASLFTIWMDDKLSKKDGKTGLITFGAVDTINCHPAINYVPLSSKSHWQFAMEGFSIGSFSQKKREQVVSDSGTSWIGAPSEIIEAIVNQTNAVYSSLNKFYTVNCSTTTNQPDLIFTINGIKYDVSPKEYILDIGVGDGKCVLAFFEILTGSMTTDWILGAPWIGTYCNVFDIGQKRIGFAKSKHSEI
ncbi:Inositol hexakisphosphate and diphosphoinositol-pentakisphosphate kinase [Parelaphostrongylus tenuis]|uniref:Inositol hexakisphosphate and diphosphoinositol-pentakisphosphate kinase n=1 Tax=Parelaphostrongylus tenuis TaxID=148309 RepID=A0AAD5WF45_PARTN|nr:Inositol hexakisphosphate and diphosphoinositol-pentakisphosphate kinase [Parelaphostrongylus tenuis]